MDNTHKSTGENCSDYQERIVELLDNDFSLKNDQFLNSHIKDCPDCQNYLEKLVVLRNGLNKPPAKNLHPDSRIIKNIIAYKNIKHGLKVTKPNPVWNSIRDLFEYRVPVYQALSGVVVIFMLFLYISSSIISPENRAIVIEYSGDYKDLTSSELYLVDTLSLNKPEKGQNAKEDSVLMSFLVPTM